MDSTRKIRYDSEKLEKLGLASYSLEELHVSYFVSYIATRITHNAVASYSYFGTKLLKFHAVTAVHVQCFLRGRHNN